MPTLQDNHRLDRYPEQSTHLRPQITSQYEAVQRKRMLIALGILLLALTAVLVKEWDFWFPAKVEVQETAEQSKSLSPPVSTSTTTVVPATESAPTTPVRERKPGKSAAPAKAPASVVVPFSTTTERAALPPMQVEVVAGNRHIDVPPKSNAIHLDVAPDAPPAATSAAAATLNAKMNAGDHVQLSPQTTRNVSVSVPPDYPLLARQMKVQGVVSLQALIARDGTIQELRILGGPGILATAAREAVKQWHFKPYLQNGQPVETQARITVNFTISTN